MLLLLDNFEQVLPAAALIGEICSPRRPALKVLTTSRTPLRVRGEREYAVPPLAVPAAGATIDGRLAGGALFAERAQAVKPELRAHRRQLDGGRRDLPPAGGHPARDRARGRTGQAADAGSRSSARLEEKRLSFLTGGGGAAGDAPRRDRLELRPARRARQVALRAPRVFVGGTSLETAENVAGQPLGLEFGEVLDSIASLVDNGLVRQVEASDGEPRFKMLETIREFALERLTERGELEDARNRHLTASSSSPRPPSRS